MPISLLAALLVLLPMGLPAQTPAATEAPPSRYLLRPARVFDAVAARPHEGWAVLVEGERIAAVGPAGSIQAGGARVVDLPGTTLIPGLIEGHSHLLLHPYDGP